MRKITEWDETDLFRLINDKLQESFKLDYKRLAALDNRDEISKDISAFANSSGGVIVYGIVEAEHLPSHLDQDKPKKYLDRETLENVITSTVFPRINNLVIKSIDLSSGATAYVVEIPAATVFGPHQAKDKRYYRRFNFKSVPMEDYEVREAFKRSNSPLIRVRPTWEPDANLKGSAEFGKFSLHLENLADEPSLYTAVHLILDRRIADPGVLLGNSFINMSEDIDGQSGISVLACNKNIMVPSSMPLFKGKSYRLASFSVLSPKPGPYLIGYRIASPGFVGSGSGLFELDGWVLRAVNSDAASMIAPASHVEEI